ncbi:MAG: AbrB/MazE/SpoVT family DNA-binding domain-containing protein, partial [Leptolyngbya sp. SIO4C1]|nr:AbrB/MazE/SpoVT family DNA-binding domain-containing protein [Leptolyngbya sp. SIO4C1]
MTYSTAHSSDYSAAQTSADTVARTRIVKIGNSQGIRIPKFIVEQLGLSGEVELEVKDGQLLIRSLQAPRQQWAEQFKQMAEAQDDRLL